MLTAEGVTKAFDGPDGRITVLDGATLSLAAGTRLGLAGPSGCGKSTLAAVLALLLAPDAGRVVLDGDPVTGHGLAVPKQMRRQVQLIWQSPRQAADPRLTLAPRYLLCDEPTSMLDVST
ncbi:MAG: ATP-binding cassette domain-containing protein [Pseudonocardiaceae bacterium]